MPAVKPEASGSQSPTRNESFTGKWAWLFPISYLVHIAEEYWGGFPAWIARFWGVESSLSNFLSWNGGALVMMTIGVALTLKTKSYRWLLVSFGTVVLINGLVHAGASVLTRSYSPGVISGLLLFIPLGAITLMRARSQVNRRTLRAGVIVGLLMHGAVVLLAFGFARLSA
jgi:hypothetical protein